MKKEPNIEQLFQDKFASFEPKVNPNAWNAINSKIGNNAAGASTSASISKTFISTFFAAATIVAGVSGNAIYQSQQEKAELATVLNEKTISTKPAEKTEAIKTIEVVSVENVYLDIDKSADSDKVISENISDIKSELTTSNEQFDAVDELLEHQIDALIRANRIDKTDLTDISLSEDPVKTTVVKEENKTAVNVDCSFTYEVSEEDYHAVQFLSSCAAEVNYNWNFDDGETSNERNPKHYFTQEGTYEVVLEVIGSNNEREEYNMKVVVTEPSSIAKMPNVFTPNGDLYNDLYFIETKNIETIEVTIIDRNGQVVFEANDPNFKWNGTDFFGEPVAEGGYICVLKAVGKDGKKHTKTKSFVLKR